MLQKILNISNIYPHWIFLLETFELWTYSIIQENYIYIIFLFLCLNVQYNFSDQSFKYFSVLNVYVAFLTQYCVLN